MNISAQRKSEPRHFTVDDPLVTGGQLVEARPRGRVGLATSGSTRVLGVALADGTSPEARAGDTVATVHAAPEGRGPIRPLEHGTMQAGGLPTAVPVTAPGDDSLVRYAADADFGDLLVAADEGTVAPWRPASADQSPDPLLIVGRCSEAGGVDVARQPLARMRTTV